MEVAVIGLGTMGANLARNAARQDAKVMVYNRTTEKTDEFMKHFGHDGNFVACNNYEELCGSFNAKKVILIMVKAGPAVDAVIDELLPHLSKGDILIDGGNSNFSDTDRRIEKLDALDIDYLGMGVSGGEDGALEGPSMMPGGSLKAYKHVAPLLEKMAADDGDGGSCVTYVGPGSAGHFVKMVHNGIEYGIMQLMAESYDLLKYLGEFDNESLVEIFTAWNQTEELQGYLTEITAEIFKKADPEGEGSLIDSIHDAAGQKGTGKWTTIAALDLGVSIPTINAAVDARIMSGSTKERMEGKDLPVEIDDTEPIPKAMRFRSAIRSGMELSSICAYAQGFDLIQKASEEYEWNVDLSEVARIWRGGCIIRSALLKKLQAAYGSDAKNAKAATEYLLHRFGGERQIEWRRVTELGCSYNIPVPALSASLSYFDAMTRDRLPQCLVQAQRDYFGAHTYRRTDKEGSFHTEW